MAADNKPWISLKSPYIKKSDGWRHYGFPVYESDSKRTTDKTKTECHLCIVTVPYNGNTTNMRVHLPMHYPNDEMKYRDMYRIVT